MPSSSTRSLATLLSVDDAICQFVRLLLRMLDGMMQRSLKRRRYGAHIPFLPLSTHGITAQNERVPTVTGETGLDANVRELAIISVIACFGLALVGEQ